MLAEYLLIIPTSSSVEKVILHLKDELYYKIGSYLSRNSQPHISVLWVYMDDSLESILCESLRNIIAQERPIILTTNSIKSFLSSKTIYLGIEEISLFEQMSRNIGKSSFISCFPSKYKRSTYVPHITVGRNLEHSFDFARNFFGEYSYAESFMASSALLLKRYDEGRYIRVEEFPFCAVASVQLPLLHLTK